jgi:hypothetical protein
MSYLVIENPILDNEYPVPCDAVAAAAVPAVVAIPISLLVADAYDVKVPTAGDNIKTSDGANVISMVISPYNDVSMMVVLALGPNRPNQVRTV